MKPWLVGDRGAGGGAMVGAGRPALKDKVPGAVVSAGAVRAAIAWCGGWAVGAVGVGIILVTSKGEKRYSEL